MATTDERVEATESSVSINAGLDHDLVLDLAQDAEVGAVVEVGEVTVDLQWDFGASDPADDSTIQAKLCPVSSRNGETLEDGLGVQQVSTPSSGAYDVPIRLVPDEGYTDYVLRVTNDTDLNITGLEIVARWYRRVHT